MRNQFFFFLNYGMYITPIISSGCVGYHCKKRKKRMFPYLPFFNFFVLLFLASHNVEKSFFKHIDRVVSRDFSKFERMNLKIQVVLTGLVSTILYRSTLSSWVISLNVMCGVFSLTQSFSVFAVIDCYWLIDWLSQHYLHKNRLSEHNIFEMDNGDEDDFDMVDVGEMQRTTWIVSWNSWIERI